MPAKKRTLRVGNWYKADDERVHFIRKRKVYFEFIILDSKTI